MFFNIDKMSELLEAMKDAHVTQVVGPQTGLPECVKGFGSL